MTKNVYRTAQGRTIDMGALILQNEKTRAVGNMNVNARGDLIDANGQVIDPRNQQVQTHYERQISPDYFGPTTSESTVVNNSVVAVTPVGRKPAPEVNNDEFLTTVAAAPVTAAKPTANPAQDMIKVQEALVDPTDTFADLDDLGDDIAETTVEAGGLAGALNKAKKKS